MIIGRLLCHVTRSVRDNWLGCAIGLFGIALALYFGLQGEGTRHPQLLVTEEPILVYDPAVTEAFTLSPNPGGILWEGSRDLEADRVWAVTLAFWNSGERSIKTDNILSALRVQVGDGETLPSVIWELRSTNWSRPEVEFAVLADQIALNDGAPQIPIAFRILERDDGARLQLIYSGPKAMPVSLRGTIKGVRTQDPPLRRLTVWGSLVPGALALVFGVALAALSAVALARRFNLAVPHVPPIATTRPALLIMAIYAIAAIVAGAVLLGGDNLRTFPEVPLLEYRPPV